MNDANQKTYAEQPDQAGRSEMKGKRMMARLWTRKCRGTCGDSNWHTHDLTWFGRWYFGRFAK